MFIVPVVVNATVICFICAELVAVFLGKASADQLLVGSILSGILTLISFKLSKEALLHINAVEDELEALEQPKSSDA